MPCSTQAFTGTVSPRLNARQSQFSKRLDLEGGGGEVQFWKCTKCEGVEVLRHRTGLLCKSCQTILWLRQIHVSFKSRQKIRFGGFLSATKCYPYKAWTRNLSAISPTRNVVCMCAHTPMHKADIWKKYVAFFYFLKVFLSLNRDKYFAILSWSICRYDNFVRYHVSTCTAERSFSGMKRLRTPLRRTMTGERLSSLSILHMSTRT